MNIAEVMREWNTFYSVLAGSTATLFGLLFFAVTLNARELQRDQHARLFRLAGLTFSNFLILFLLSLQMLIPATKEMSVHAMWTIIAIVGIIWTIRLSLEARKAEIGEHNGLIGKAFRLSFIAYVVLLILGTYTFTTFKETMQLLIIPVMMLLANSVRNSWGLMVLISPEKE